MKRLILLSSVAFTFVTSPALAQDNTQEFLGGTASGSVVFATDYVFRGLSQTDEGPALQGSLDYNHESGFYLGVWGSNVDFNDTDESSVEVDIYTGFSGDFKGLTYDLGAIVYYYPGTDDAVVNDNELDYDYVEGAFALGYDFDAAAISVSLNYSPDYFGGSGEAFYYAAALDIPLPEDFSLSAHVGYQAVDDNTAFGAPDYTDWSLGVGYAVSGFDLALQYIGTDLDEPEDIADGSGDRAVFTLGRSF